MGALNLAIIYTQQSNISDICHVQILIIFLINFSCNFTREYAWMSFMSNYFNGFLSGNLKFA